jgi:hypothetical protein
MSPCWGSSRRGYSARRLREAGRIARSPLGRISLDALAEGAPTHADVYLLVHASGVALWEAWLPAQRQPFDAGRLIAMLDAEAPESLVGRSWKVLGPVNEHATGKPTWSGLYLSLGMLRTPQRSLHGFVERHGPDLVRLLFLDASGRPLKPGIATDELARDYFGATEIGFIASSIATWRYQSNLWAVLGWPVGAALASGLGLAALLRGRAKCLRPTAAPGVLGNRFAALTRRVVWLRCSRSFPENQS